MKLKFYGFLVLLVLFMIQIDPIDKFDLCSFNFALMTFVATERSRILEFFHSWISSNILEYVPPEYVSVRFLKNVFRSQTGWIRGQVDLERWFRAIKAIIKRSLYTLTMKRDEKWNFELFNAILKSNTKTNALS